MSDFRFLDDHSDREIINEVHSTNTQFRRSKGELLLAIAQFHLRNLAELGGAKSTTAWLTRTIGVSKQTAHEYIQIGSCMLEFRLAAGALLAGEISYSALRLLQKYLAFDNEADLVQLARELTLNELKLALAGLDPAEDPKPVKDKFSYSIGPDGRVTGTFNLNPVDGANLISAIKIGELAFKEDFGGLAEEDFADDEKVDEAHEKLERPDPSRFGLTPHANKLPALRGLLNLARTSPKSSKRAPGAQINVTMTTDGHAFLPYQPEAPNSQLRGIIENGLFRLNLVDDNGIVVNRGRERRLASDSQVDCALEQSRRQCAIPGCENCNFIEIHHLDDWAEGGETNMDNLLALCSSCHTMVTMGQIEIVKEGNELHYFFPDGSWYTSTKRQAPKLQREASKPKKKSLSSWIFGPFNSFDDSVVDVS